MVEIFERVPTGKGLDKATCGYTSSSDMAIYQAEMLSVDNAYRGIKYPIFTIFSVPLAQ